MLKSRVESFKAAHHSLDPTSLAVFAICRVFARAAPGQSQRLRRNRRWGFSGSFEHLLALAVRRRAGQSKAHPIVVGETIGLCHHLPSRFILHVLLLERTIQDAFVVAIRRR
ncbi:hypothetical protein D910_02016, partial [Dendroctonus ponderosae]